MQGSVKLSWIWEGWRLELDQKRMSKFKVHGVRGAKGRKMKINIGRVNIGTRLEKHVQI